MHTIPMRRATYGHVLLCVGFCMRLRYYLRCASDFAGESMTEIQRNAAAKLESTNATAWESKSNSAAWILSVAICLTFFLPATRRVFSYLREIRVERHLRTRGVCAAGWHKVRESAVFRRNRL